MTPSVMALVPGRILEQDLSMCLQMLLWEESSIGCPWMTLHTHLRFYNCLNKRLNFLKSPFVFHCFQEESV